MVGRLKCVFVLVGVGLQSQFSKVSGCDCFFLRYNCVTRLVYINLLLYPLLIKMSSLRVLWSSSLCLFHDLES